MPKFKVELERPAPSEGQTRNPFVGGICGNITMSIRSWEFEAKDEAEVRRLLDEAIAQNIPNVRGYRLRSIQEIRPGKGG